MPIGAIVGGLGSLAGSMIGANAQRQANIQNMQLAKYQNNWQTAENEKAYARSVEMWNMQNQYNSPTAQMSRLRQAGLNPNLVYGSGVTGNSAGSAPQYQPAKIQRATMEPYRGWNLGISDAVSTFMAMRQKKHRLKIWKLKISSLKNRLELKVFAKAILLCLLHALGLILTSLVSFVTYLLIVP